MNQSLSTMTTSKRLAGLLQPTVWQEFTPLAVEHGAVNLGQGFPDWYYIHTYVHPYIHRL